MRRVRVRVASVVVVACAWIAPAPLRARAAEGALVDSAFFVAKSENRNQVHYAVRVDERCAPLGAEPVVPYWRMYELGPRAREGLLDREQPAYGVAAQAVVQRGEGGVVRVRLRALGGRLVEIRTFRGPAGCEARALTTIAGAPSTLHHVFVELAWPFGVAYLRLVGVRAVDGRAVHEDVRG